MTTLNESEKPKEPLAEATKERIVYYSHTTLKNQAQCPAKNFFRRLARQGLIEEDPALPLVFGSGVHAAIEHRLKYERNPHHTLKEYVDKELSEKFPQGQFDREEADEKWKMATTCIDNFETYLYRDLAAQITDPEKQVELALETPFRKGVLVGKVDIALPGIFADWKTGRIPTDFNITNDPQAGFYFYLAQKCGLETPKEFVYVYLIGKNIARKSEVIKRGPNAGNLREVEDKDHPKMKLSYPTYPTTESVERLFNNYVIPLAKAYEEGIVYKVRNTMNCSTCSYRTACKDFDLPSIDE